MYTMTLNKTFEVVDLQPGAPRADARQFPVSEAEFLRMRGKDGDLNTVAGTPRWRWDSLNGRAVPAGGE